ncbi:MAG: DctP family TRAP transporter solute-binding subunit [Clostridium sp.]|nr:DctP family TRAP transporter solute-binding subunit [Clostridium sp.]
MRKKVISIVLAAVILGTAGCGGKQASGTGDIGHQASSGSVIELSVFAGSIAENTPTGTGLKAMVDYINENGGGTLKATDYYDTALGDATSMVQGLQQGTVDIGVSGTAYFSGLVPEVEVFQLPFLFDNLEDARAAVDGEAADKIFEKFGEKGIVGLTFWENGFRELTNNVRPVSAPADLSGIKMRTLPATVQVETWKALGALPTTIDASELYTALQQGTVSAEENPLHEVVSRKFYEVQKYITLTDHVYTPFMMGISQKTWDKLNDEQKQVVRDGAQAGKEAQRKANEEMTEEAMQVLLDHGCEVVENPDKEAFKEIAVGVWNVFTDENGTELLDIIQGN